MLLRRLSTHWLAVGAKAEPQRFSAHAHACAHRHVWARAEAGLAVGAGVSGLSRRRMRETQLLPSATMTQVMSWYAVHVWSALERGALRLKIALGRRTYDIHVIYSRIQM